MMNKTKNTVCARIFAVLIAAALVTALLPLAGCGDKESAAGAPYGMKAISNELVDYNLYVPDGWIEDISTRFISAYAGASDRSSVSVEAFGMEDTSQTLEEFWEGFDADFKSTFPDIEYESEESALLGGVAAMKYVYTATVTGIKYKFMQVTAMRGGYVYIFTYTSLPERFDKHLEAVASILDSFSFKK